MFPRKLYTLPFHLGLAISLLLLVAINVMLYRSNHHSLPTQLYSQKSSSGYSVGPGKTIQNIGDDLTDPKFWDDLQKQLKQAKYEEIYQDLKRAIRLEKYDLLVEELKNSIRQDKSKELIDQLKMRIDLSYTHEYMKFKEKSYTLLEELKLTYLSQNLESLKNDLTKEIAKTYNMGEYVKFLLLDVLLQIEISTRKFDDNDLKDRLPSLVKKLPEESDILNSERLSSFLEINSDKEKAFAESHLNALKSIQDLPVPPVFQGDGIVIYAKNQKDLLHAVTIVKQLRELKSALPIEIMTLRKYQSVCDQLKQLNAKCVVISDVLGHSIFADLQEKKVNMKSIGLLISSFDNIVSLDGSIPLKNIDKIFNSSLYRLYKWIVFPSTVHRTVSPLYYKMTGTTIGEAKSRICLDNEKDFSRYIDDRSQICLHDLEGAPSAISSDSTEMIFLKRAHFNSFLLAVYYSLNRDFYYPMLYQTKEDSDRETWVAALNTLKEPYYNVETLPMHFKSNIPNEPAKLYQFDPEESQAFLSEWKDYLISKKLDSRLFPFQDNKYTKELLTGFLEGRKVTKWVSSQGGGPPVLSEVDYQLPSPYFMHLQPDKIKKVDENEIVSDKTVREAKYEQHFNNWQNWVKCEFLNTELLDSLGEKKPDDCGILMAEVMKASESAAKVDAKKDVPKKEGDLGNGDQSGGN